MNPSPIQRSRTARAAIPLLALWAVTTHADVLVNEVFAYPEGPLVEVSAGQWTTHSGTAGQADVIGGAAHLTDQESEDVSLALTGGPFPASSEGVLYAAFTLSLSELPRGSGGFFAHFKDGTTGFRARIFAATTGAAEGGFRVGVSEGTTTPALLETDLSPHTTYTLVCRYEIKTAATTLWVDPTEESSPGVVATDDGTAISVHGFALRQSSSSGNSMGTLVVDDLRIATSFAELFAPVGDVPTITRPPQDLTVAPGGDAPFSVAATGLPPLSYQWTHDGLTLPGATGPTLTLAHVDAEDAGSYQVTVSNSAGSVTSGAATLTVTPAPPAGAPPNVRFTNRLENLVRPGDQLTNTFTEHGLRPGEQLSLSVLVTDPAGNLVTVQPVADGLPPSAYWTFLVQSGPSVEGTFTMAPTEADAGQLSVIRLLAWNDVATNTLAWQIDVPTVAEQRVAITEYLANPTANAEAGHYNPLHRDPPSNNTGQHDEFVELVNLSATDLSLEGWTLADALQTRCRFDATTSLLASNAVVVFGGPLDGSLPSLDVPVLPANEGSAGLALNNTGDSIVLRNAAGGVVDRVVYSAAMVSSQGSMTRHPSLDDGFVPQANVGPRPVTPGRRSDAQLWSEEDTPPPAQIGTLHGRVNADGTLTLTWEFEPGRTYSVLVARSPDGPWSGLATDLTQGECTQPVDEGVRVRFYRVRSP